MLTEWDKLPDVMRNDSVREYYDILQNKKASLAAKRAFDLLLSASLLTLLSPAFLGLAVAIKADSKGPVFYRQTRITKDNRAFRIHKFRSMVTDADKGLHLTAGNDSRITRTGRFIRRFKLDELPQLIDVFLGDMSFVGTRPEVPEYVEQYTDEMYATLLLPAGMTSRASVLYKNEADVLKAADDTEKAYLETVLPDKMRYNLGQLKGFSLADDLKTILETAFEICR